MNSPFGNLRDFYTSGKYPIKIPNNLRMKLSFEKVVGGTHYERSFLEFQTNM